MESRGTHNVYYVKLYLFVTATSNVTCTCKPGFALNYQNPIKSRPCIPFLRTFRAFRGSSVQILQN
ncbi:hypothetical protein ALP70_200174 [Pseudomonas savastanoi]|uniref:Uncharacterized protein n=1 Tax=Pseudomonas savastanoi TaxID=29438 RepID=A0A3M5BXS5_PSESS|nr:hypothetical protein ALP70_200174 [Pseudomonas savastanoi]